MGPAMHDSPERKTARARTAIVRALALGIVALPAVIASACASEPNIIDLLPLTRSTGGEGQDGGGQPAQSGPCTSDDDCTKSAPFCNVTDGRCVQCMTAADCPNGEVCRAETHFCEPRCQSPEDCVGIDRPVCSATGVCVECTSDNDCGAGATPHCNLLNGVCVQCIQNADCGSTFCFDDCHVCLNNLCVWRT
jgi:Cys-rich repeat protein